MNMPAKFEVHIALAVPEIIVIAVLGWGCDLSLPNLGEGEAIERWQLPIGSP